MFDPSNIFAGFIFGMIGFMGFKFGKSEGNVKRMLLGATLVIYPYFVANSYLLWGLGIVLTALMIWWKEDY